jgi:hypothetical protein
MGRWLSDATLDRVMPTAPLLTPVVHGIAIGGHERRPRVLHLDS